MEDLPSPRKLERSMTPFLYPCRVGRRTFNYCSRCDVVYNWTRGGQMCACWTSAIGKGRCCDCKRFFEICNCWDELPDDMYACIDDTKEYKFKVYTGPRTMENWGNSLKMFETESNMKTFVCGYLRTIWKDEMRQGVYEHNGLTVQIVTIK